MWSRLDHTALVDAHLVDHASMLQAVLPRDDLGNAVHLDAKQRRTKPLIVVPLGERVGGRNGGKEKARMQFK